MDNNAPKEPFDHGQASFWLVAFVIAWLLLISAVFVGGCFFFEPTLKECDTNGRFGEILTTILSSALAYAAGRVQK